MGIISVFRSTSSIASLICLASAVICVFFALGLLNFFPEMIVFLFLAALSIYAAVYFREQKDLF